MLIVERQNQVAEMLRERGSAQLEELAEALGVSASTIRRDLEVLEQRGQVERTHGGAIYQGNAHRSDDALGAGLTTRMSEAVQQKQAIGRCAAALVQPNMTLLLDGGSTVIFAVRQIEVRPLQVVTNSLAIANHFADDEQVELLVVGGSHYPRTGILVGPIATGCLADLNADLCFFSLAGIYDGAAYNTNLEMARVEKIMLQQASQSVLLMDSSKFGRKSLVRVCGVSNVDHIITDTGIDDQWRDRLADNLVVAEEQNNNDR